MAPLSRDLWQDLCHSLRVLAHSPGFTIAAVAVLALAMGANGAIFSVIEAVLLRPLPYRDASRLCVLWKSVPARNIEWDWTSYPTIRDWRAQSRSFEDLAVLLRPEGSFVTLATEAGPEKIHGSKVTGNFFEVLGVAPLLGRTFSQSELRTGANLAVLSHGFWQRRFASNPSALGRTLEVDRQSVTIIGVMPPGFAFPDKSTQLWTLITADSRWPSFERFRVADAFCALGRLRSGVSVEEARAEMDAIAGRLSRQYPATDSGLGVRLVPLFQQIAGAPVRRALWILGGAVLCVLLVACSNIASLLMARGAARRSELAVRAAIGASRGRLLRQLAAENLLLSVAGGLAGLLLAYAGLDALLALAPADLPRSDGAVINGTVLAFTFALCVLSGLVFGLAPAAQILRNHPQSSLHQTGRISAGRGVQRTRSVLVAVQFALAILLLTGAGLLLHSFLLLNSHQPGFDTSRLLTMRPQLPADRYLNEARRRIFFDEAVRRIEALPGARGAAVGSAVFDSLREHVPNQNLVIEGRASAQDVERHIRNIVSEGYFRVLGIPLREGMFPSHASGSEDAVINETMARRYWPSESAIGKRFKEVLPGMDGPWFTVGGVVGDVLYNRDGGAVPVFYLLNSRWSFLTDMEIVVRTSTDPLSLTQPVRRAVQSLDPAVPLFDIATVGHRLEELDRPRRFETWLIGAFAAAALLLAALGLYGLISYSVEQRTREIGIRLALGATSHDIVKLVLRQGLGSAAAGVTLGIAAALACGRILSSLLYGVTASDPVTLGAVIALLALVSTAASSLPARRATRVDPNVALRHE